MRNPFLVPELRELLSKNDQQALREFCSSSHPETVAEFIGGLTSVEVWQVLNILEPRLRAEIYGHLDGELQIELAESLRPQELRGM